ncbi:PREDICTED: uncharacterized protein LOC109131591 [Camelina sativa]|uniref:Uncharacterized protein LOC109131591 n=1 Tax=Camelina sativa TaxID=90675 RepID=A0ABM1RGZ4_CAMSA|nr:PREDICTED: uncharacterized protein LOC109131591 [Camelina sativa]
MVSTVRTTRRQPKWIGTTLWTTMTEFWDTEEAQQRSKTYSDCRMSDRNGLGPHVHLSGPKSYRQIQNEMEEELGREVRIGEVFIKAHTKPDGTYVDRKAEKIAETYEKNVQERLSQLQEDPSAISDGESRPRELTTEEYTEIFLQSTEKDSGKQAGDTLAFVAMQEQLKEAQRKIEEQAANMLRRDAEMLKRDAQIAQQSEIIAGQKEKIDELDLVGKFLRQCDPRFKEFLTAHSAKETTTTEPLQEEDPTSTP